MVNENNIEQRIFEYHEGLMDASQKNELMEYLHQYPEYQRDFAIWAQARLHDEGVAIPVFQEKLMKPTAWFASAISKWSVGIGTLAVVCLLMFRFYPENRQNEVAPVKTILQEQNSKSVNQNKPLIDNEKQTISVFRKKNTLPKEEVKTVLVSTEKEENKPIETVKQEIIETEHVIPEKPIVQEEVISKEDLNTDNYNKYLDEPIEEEPETGDEAEKLAKPKKPKRPKQKMNLRPNADILPTSPNF